MNQHFSPASMVYALRRADLSEREGRRARHLLALDIILTIPSLIQADDMISSPGMIKILEEACLPTSGKNVGG